MRTLVLSLAIASTALAAGLPFKRQLSAASTSLNSAANKARRSGNMCREAMTQQLNATASTLDGLGDSCRPEDLLGVKMNLTGMAMTSSMSGCPLSVTEDITNAAEAVEEARRTLYQTRLPPPPTRRPDNRPPELPPVQAPLFGAMEPLRITTDSVWNQEQSVRLQVPELTLNGMLGRTFYIGVRYRSLQGQWSEWVTSQLWSVPRDPFVWKNAFNHFIPYSALAEDDFADGRFMARVSVFDGEGHELVSRDGVFRVRLAPLPVQLACIPGQNQTCNDDPRFNVILGQCTNSGCLCALGAQLNPATGRCVPAQVQVVQPPLRDCGTGQDPACGRQRNGRFPMDATGFQGLLAALRANFSEMHRSEMLRDALRVNVLTALQLGMVLDLFNSEMHKMDVAKAAASRVVDPEHALVLATKFNSSMRQREFTQVMTSQSADQNQVPVQPMQPMQPIQPMQPMQPAQVGFRDCGTGQDPGCTMQRNGQLPMDAVTFQGFLQSVKGVANEITQREMCEKIVARNYLTALQFGQMLGLFRNELSRLDLAKSSASHVVNPQHALGLASTFNNSILAGEFTQVMVAQ